MGWGKLSLKDLRLLLQHELWDSFGKLMELHAWVGRGFLLFPSVVLILFEILNKTSINYASYLLPRGSLGMAR